MTGDSQSIAGAEQQHEVPNEEVALPVRPISPPIASGEEEQPDHPQGDAIRRQVEYYFSDENLPTDQHLLALCGGAENKPVSIGEIMSWRKMRKILPKNRKLFTAALRKSAFLEVVNDKQVRRRVPLLVDNDAGVDIEQADSARRPSNVVGRSSQLPANQEEYPPWMTKNMRKPTGFEENWCDAPTTPAEAKEEEEVYAPSIRFSERIEIAIQRYKAKRKFHQETLTIFENFMKFGGIEAGPRQFTGGFTDYEDMDAAQIALAKATHFAGEDKDDPDLWAVDFEGVAKGFLSSYMENLSDDWVDKNTRVMINFYNYLMMHDVCPEYTSDILAARAVCIQARKELSVVRQAAIELPGAFNTAVSVLYGGYFSTIYGDSSWDPNSETDYYGQRREEARIALLTGLALLGSDQMYDAVAVADNNDATSTSAEASNEGDAWISKLHITKLLEDIGLVVVAVQMPTDDVKADYAAQEQLLHTSHKQSSMSRQPLGKLLCKRWNIPDFRDYDLPPRGARTDAESIDWDFTLEFWLEEDILRSCFVGLHMNLTARRLEVVKGHNPPETHAGESSEGIWVIDRVNGVFPSFYTCLLNELAIGKVKEVKWLEEKDDENPEGKGIAAETAEDEYE